MRYPNAFSGVKKIWLAEILMLFAAVLSIVLIFVVAANSTMNGEELVVSDSITTAAGAITIGTALIVLVAFVLNLIGLINARKDESSFSNALLFTLLGIAAGIVSAVWNGSTRLVKSMEVVTTLCNLFASYYVLTGIANLADTYPDSSTKAIVLKSRKLLIYTFCMTAVFKCIITIFNVQEGSTSYTIYGIIALVLEIASYILYLLALSRGKKMLSK